jgi:hypothetical protein
VLSWRSKRETYSLPIPAIPGKALRSSNNGCIILQ